MIAAVRSVMQSRRVVGIEPERVVDLGEHRHRARGDDGVHGGDERERGDDHLVAAADAERGERAPQRRGAVRDRDGVRAAEHVARGPLEVGDRARWRAVLVAEQRTAATTAATASASSAPSSAAPFAKSSGSVRTGVPPSIASVKSSRSTQAIVR